MPTQVARLLKIVVGLLLPILLVVGSVRLLVTDQYLVLEYNKADFPSDPFGFDNAQRLAFAAANFRYVREAQPIETLANQRLGDSPLYNNRELKHMQDVQNVYQAIWRLWQIAVAVFALAALALGWRADTRPALIDAFKWGGLLTGGLIAIVGLLAIVAWRLWFVAFHKIFFAAGTWMFNYSDTLIRLFPENFWFDAALTISGLTLIGGLLFAWVGWRLRVKTQAAPLSATLSASQS